MRLHKPVLALAAVVVLGPIGACAPSVGTSGSGATSAGAAMQSRVTVRVNNNLTPPTSISVFAVQQTGSRMLVGHVSPAKTATLHFNPSGAAFSYRFMARTTGGAEVVSNPISVRAGETLAWELQANILRVVDES